MAAEEVTGHDLVPRDRAVDNIRFEAQVVRGGRWSVISLAVKQIGRTVFAILLARYIGPNDFGVVSQASLYVAITAIFVELGFSAALVQTHDLTDDDVATATWLNVFSATLFAVVTLGAAPLVADFFDTPELAPVLRVLAIATVMRGLALVPVALLTRRVAFKTMGIAEILATVVSGVIGLIAAYNGASYWAIVWQTLVYEAMVLALLAWRVGRPPLHPSRRSLGKLWRFGGPVMGSQFVTYWIRNADNILIGRVLGRVQLSFYAVSYRMLLLPMQVVGQAANRLALPVFSRLQGDRRALARYYLAGTEVVAAVLFPFATGVAVSAPLAVRVVLGDEWLPAVDPMRILSATIVPQVIMLLVASLLLGAGKARRVLWWTLVAGAGTIVGFVIGLEWGVAGVAWGFFAALCVLAPLSVRMVRTEAEVSGLQLVARLLPLLGACGLLAAVWLLLDRAGTAADVSDAARLIVNSLIAVVSYVVALWVGWPATWHRLVRLARAIVGFEGR